MNRWRRLELIARRVTTVLLIPLCAAGVLVAAPGMACACSCAGLTARQAFEHADAVFIGRVVGRDVERSTWPFSSSNDPAVWTFEVTKVYKGEVRQRQEVVTPAFGASCGLELQGSGPFAVYATHDAVDYMPAPGEGQLAAHLCNGTGPVTAEVRRMLDQVPATDPIPTPEGRGQGWPVVGLGIAAGVAVLAAGAFWLWRRRRRPAG